ncbi:MAG: hypothetical protein HDR34_07810 [Treponema sp.]|nr:hypothetical protein [Treponema sp.]
MADYKDERATNSLRLIFGDEIIETVPVDEKELLSIDSIGNWTGHKPLPKEVSYHSPMPSRGNPMLIEEKYVTMFQIDNKIEQMKAEYLGG